MSDVRLVPLVFVPAVLCAFLCATPVAALGQANAPVQDRPQARAERRVHRDLPYVIDGHERQKLDLYLPTGAATDRPVLVWIHGGAWEGGSKSRCPALGMVARGYAVASLNYRLSQHAVFPAQIEDCKAVIRWLRAHAPEYGIDPQRVGVWGASAGGHLAALLGTTEHTREFDRGEHLDQSSAVQCVLDWFGPSDFLRWGSGVLTRREGANSPVVRLLGGLVSEREDLARSASPVYSVRKGAAPFLIMHGDRDLLVPVQQSEVLHAALEKAGVESRLEVIADGAHGGPDFTSPEKLSAMMEFFDRHLARRSVRAVLP